MSPGQSSRKYLLKEKIYCSISCMGLKIAWEKHILTSSIRSMDVWKYNQYKASHTNSNAKELPEPVLGLEKYPSKNNDAWNRPTIQQHHACQRCVLVWLHNCPNWRQQKTIQITEPTETAFSFNLRQLYTDVIRFDVDNSKDQIVVPFYLHKKVTNFTSWLRQALSK